MKLFLTILKFSFFNLWANKLRSFLSMLGILIGVGAVIALVSLGQGARVSMTAMIRQFGADIVILTPRLMKHGGVSINTVERLSVDDAKAILIEVPEVEALSPRLDQSVQAKVGANNTRCTLMGSASPYPRMMNFKFAAGRTFTPLEEERNRKVAYLGSKIVEDLFGGDPHGAIGGEIKLNGVSYRVIGALEEKGGPEGLNPDAYIFIPYSTAMKRIVGTRYIGALTIKIRSEDEVEQALLGITRVMRKRHRITPDKEDDFQIFSFQDALNSIRASAAVFSLLLAGIGGISLLVGGIGIMNIMLVTVTERTREIGLRKALGAKRSDIMIMFLIESIMITMIGGLMGVASGYGAAAVANRIAAHLSRNSESGGFVFQATVTPASVIIALTVCVVVGVFFGIYPARRAARLDPILALHHE